MGLIRRQAYKNPSVEKVFVTIGEDGLNDYWVVIPTRNIDVVRELIRNQQENVIDIFSGISNPPFQLDFHIVYREGRQFRELVPDQAIEIPNF